MPKATANETEETREYIPPSSLEAARDHWDGGGLVMRDGVLVRQDGGLAMRDGGLAMQGGGLVRQNGGLGLSRTWARERTASGGNECTYVGQKPDIRTEGEVGRKTKSSRARSALSPLLSP